MLIVALALGACDSGGSHDRSTLPPSIDTMSTAPSPTPTPTPTPTVPADVPTTGPNLLRAGETPPVMPIEATHHTPNGAVAFATFFIATIDWGYATTSSAYMKHYYTQACVTCVGIQQGLDSARAKGRHFIGDRITVTAVLSAKPDTANGAEFSAVLGFSVSSVEVVDAKGQFVSGQPALKLKNQVSMSWIGTSWQVVFVVGIR